MYYVTKALQDFSTTHRLGRNYPEKCRNLHGHNYSVQVTLGAPHLDKYDMAIDFGTIKTLFNKWVQDSWDHATLVSESDITLLDFLKKENNKYFLLSSNQNSTAEFMSKFLFEKFSELLKEEIERLKQKLLAQAKDKNTEKELLKKLALNDEKEPLLNGVFVVEVKVWETKDSFATYRYN